MNKKIRICKLGMKISNSVMIVQAVVFTFLFFAVNTAVTGNTRNTAINNMKTAAIDRSEIIENYIASTEDTLTAYLKAEQIYDLLRDPENPENVAAAQEYTERFGKDLTNLEGIYASSWDTKMLTHTNAGVVGKLPVPTRLSASSFTTLFLQHRAYIIRALSFLPQQASRLSPCIRR